MRRVEDNKTSGASNRESCVRGMAAMMRGRVPPRFGVSPFGATDRASSRPFLWLLALVMLFLFTGPGLATTEAAKPPVLLVYGFQPLPGFYPPVLWESFAEALSGQSLSDVEKITIESGHQVYRLAGANLEGRDVIMSDYTMRFEPTVRDLRFYADRLAAEIAWVSAAYDSATVDVVAHSMGGLIARCYIEAGDFAAVLGSPDFEEFATVYENDVRVLITLATPHHGANFAAVGPWYGALARQLAPDSRLLELLNRAEPGESALHPDVRYVALAGQSCLGCGLRRDETDCLRACAEEGETWDGSDLVVRMASAWLDEGENIACIGFNHVEMRTHPMLLETVLHALDGDPLPSVIYRFESMSTEATGGNWTSDSSTQTD